MPDKTEIAREDFIAACCTVAAVLADGWWHSARLPGESVKRSAAAGTSAAMDCVAAAKHCGFGRTRFRELVTDGKFPQPVTIEGRKRWLVKDLDMALARIAREQRRRK